MDKLKEDMIDFARAMIALRKAHFKRVMEAFELCISGHPDAPTAPSAETDRLWRDFKATETHLISLAKDAPPSPIADAVRAYAHCHRSGRTVSRGYRLHDPPEVVAAAKSVSEEYIRENNAVWSRLAELAGVEPPIFTRSGAK